MSGFGTDVLAVTCILGGAAASGAATLAWMGERSSNAPVCVVETSPVRPAVVVTTLSSRSGGAVVVTPSVREHATVRRLERCAVHRAVRAEVVGIDRSQVEMRRELTRALAGAERARAAAERARAEAERARARAGEAGVPAEEIARMREEVERARAAVVRARAEMERAREEASRIRHR